MIKNPAYVDKRNAYANVGESIQAATMEYTFTKLGIPQNEIVKIDQCNLKEYQGEKVVFPLRLPLSHNTMDDFFPLPESIIPVFMSLHTHDDVFENREDMVSYLKKYEPIGCRDEKTCDIFKKHGIEAYMMGCYTLSLPTISLTESDKRHPFLVDVSDELDQAIPQEIKESAEYVSHAVPFNTYPITHEEDERLVALAKSYLEKYRNEASLIVTSRLHAAAPAIAMGIPVVLASDNVDFRYAWVDKYVHIYQSGEYEDINWHPEIIDTTYVKELLFDFFENSIETGKADRSTLQKLDKYYRERNKVTYYKCFRNRLEKLQAQYKDGEFKYAIWGAGAHAIFAHELVQEMYPKAELKVVIDKYKTGSLFGVPIDCGENLGKYNVDHVCITTNPGKAEAIDSCRLLWGESGDSNYTIITSQQKS